MKDFEKMGKIQIIKVPGINGLGKTKGARNSGNKIIKEVDSIINSKGKIINKQDFDIEEIHVDNDNLKEQLELIYKNARKAYEQEKIIFLGGDHSISYPLVRAFFDFYDEERIKPFIIVFDAHVDLMEPLPEPSHEEWLRAVIEEFGSENILVIGARKIYGKEKEFFQKSKLRVVSVEQFTSDLQDTTEFIMEASQGNPLYVSIDIDVVDPLYAPSTHYKEEHGLTSQQILFIVKKLAMMRNLKAVDIVEINSEGKEEDVEKTIKLGAKILAEFL